MTNPVLEISDVSVRYGSFQALTDVSLVVEGASIHALIGPNGAGKSTLAGSACGDITPVAGRVLLAGDDVTRLPNWKRARRGLGRSYQVARIFETLTVRENLDVACGKRNVDRIESALEQTDLLPVADKKAQDLSAGDQKRLEIAILIAQNAKVIVLDEPTAGMSAAETRLMADLILRTKERGVGILIIEHDLDLVFSLADVVSVLSFGKIVFLGSPKEVLRSPIVRTIYLHDRSEIPDDEPELASMDKE